MKLHRRDYQLKEVTPPHSHQSKSRASDDKASTTMPVFDTPIKINLDIPRRWVLSENENPLDRSTSKMGASSLHDYWGHN